jgi:hypothetical protein
MKSNPGVGSTNQPIERTKKMKTEIIMTVAMFVVAGITALAGSPELFHKLRLGMTEKQVHAALHRDPESCTPNGNGTVTCFFTGGENADASIDTVVCVFLVVNDKLIAAADLNTDESIGDRDLLK